MADEADVRTGLATLIQSVVYPSGTSSPSVIPGFSGNCWIYPNWPKPEVIDAKVPLGATPSIGDIVVAVWELPDAVVTTRFPVLDEGGTAAPVTLGWTISGKTATVTGTVSTPQNIGLVVDGAAYLYGVLPADTLSTIATAVAALVNASEPAAGVGPVITMPNAKAISGRVGVFAGTMREVARQKQTFQVQYWAPTEALRKAVSGLVKPAIDDARRLTLADGSVAMIPSGVSHPIIDVLKQGISCSATRYRVEYATTVAGTQAEVLTAATTLTQQADVTQAPVGSVIVRAY
jgi:hypothetical protein